jgi:murein L,D-transpeptidase YafK
MDKTKELEKLYILVNKNKKLLYLYGKKNNEDYKKIKTYKIKGYSGVLSPKLKRNDGQIPEGIYKPIFLNSRSYYNVSIQINYPNNFDKKQAKLDKRFDLGDNIFIHGGSATIGCIPIGDDNIEELFSIVNEVGLNNTKIVISPNDLKRYPYVLNISWEIKLYDLIKKDIQSNLKIKDW